MWRNWQTRTVQVRVTTSHGGSSPSIRTKTDPCSCKGLLFSPSFRGAGERKSKMDNRPIGFFDSGLGGLTSIPVLKEALPNEKVLYFGDTARTPYGSKQPDTIRRFARQITDYLVSKDVKMIVIACNTVTAMALELLREEHPNLPIFGVIEPTARRAAEESDEPIGIIGTKMTIASDIYAEEIRRFNPSAETHSLACPLFVPLIEEGITDHEIMDLTIRYYMDDFMKKYDIKRLILGCTHYPLIAKNLNRIYPEVKLYNSSAEVIKEVEAYLREHDMLAGPSSLPDRFYASDLSENFVRMTEQLFEGYDRKICLKKLED